MRDFSFVFLISLAVLVIVAVVSPGDSDAFIHLDLLSPRSSNYDHDVGIFNSLLSRSTELNIYDYELSARSTEAEGGGETIRRTRSETDHERGPEKVGSGSQQELQSTSSGRYSADGLRPYPSDSFPNSPRINTHHGQALLEFTGQHLSKQQEKDNKEVEKYGKLKETQFDERLDAAGEIMKLQHGKTTVSPGLRAKEEEAIRMHDATSRKYWDARHSMSQAGKSLENIGLVNKHFQDRMQKHFPPIRPDWALEDKAIHLEWESRRRRRAVLKEMEVEVNQRAPDQRTATARKFMDNYYAKFGGSSGPFDRGSGTLSGRSSNEMGSSTRYRAGSRAQKEAESQTKKGIGALAQKGAGSQTSRAGGSTWREAESRMQMSIGKGKGTSARKGEGSKSQKGTRGSARRGRVSMQKRSGSLRRTKSSPILTGSEDGINKGEGKVSAQKEASTKKADERGRFQAKDHQKEALGGKGSRSSTDVKASKQFKRGGSRATGRESRATNLLQKTGARLKNTLRGCVGGGCLAGKRAVSREPSQVYPAGPLKGVWPQLEGRSAPELIDESEVGGDLAKPKVSHPRVERDGKHQEAQGSDQGPIEGPSRSYGNRTKYEIIQTERESVREARIKRQPSNDKPSFEPGIHIVQRRTDTDSGSESAVSLGSDPYGYGRPPPMTTEQGHAIALEVGKHLKKQQVGADDQLNTLFKTPYSSLSWTQEMQNALTKKGEKGRDIEHLSMTDKKMREMMKKHFSPMPNRSKSFDWGMARVHREHLHKKTEKEARKKERADRKRAAAAAKRERVLKNSGRWTWENAKRNLRLWADKKKQEPSLSRTKSDPSHGGTDRARRVSIPKQGVAPPQTKTDSKGSLRDEATQTEAKGSPREQASQTDAKRGLARLALASKLSSMMRRIGPRGIEGDPA